MHLILEPKAILTLVVGQKAVPQELYAGMAKRIRFRLI